MDTNEAKAYLRQIKLYDIHINNKLDEMNELRNLTTKVTTTLKPDVVSNSGSQDKLGNMVAKMVDLESEINMSIDEYIDKKKEISSLIDQIDNPEQLAVLYKRYFRYEQWEQIACELHMTYRNVCYIHGRALQAVAELLKGRSDNGIS